MSRLHHDHFGDFYFDEEHTQLFANGKAVQMGRLAFQLLKSLFERRGRVVTYSALVKSLYGKDVEVRKCIDVPEVHTVQMHKRALCATIGDRWIKTYHGRGYEFLSYDNQNTNDNSNDIQAAVVEQIQ